jgi:hypothetical protein
MVDIQTISIAIASAGILVAAIYYVLQLRHQTRMRQTDVFWRIFSSFNSKEFLEAWTKIFNLEFRDYNDFVKKYGLPFSGKPVSIAINMVGNLFEGAGILLHRRLLDFKLACEALPISTTWEKMKSIVDGTRQQYNMPTLYEWFEYLYHEVKKRDKQIVKTK